MRALPPHPEPASYRLMLTFEIQPRIGVGPVKLGMTRSAVHEALGRPEWSDKEREGFLGGFFVDFDEAGRVEFIELAKSNEFEATFEGACLHRMKADEAMRIVSQLDHHDQNDPEVGYSYIFLKLQMSLWRGLIPEVDQDVADHSGRYFEAIGIGADNYFQASN